MEEYIGDVKESVFVSKDFDEVNYRYCLGGYPNTDPEISIAMMRIVYDSLISKGKNVYFMESPTGMFVTNLPSGKTERYTLTAKSRYIDGDGIIDPKHIEEDNIIFLYLVLTDSKPRVRYDVLNTSSQYMD